jgi:Collagen triple helix repeat (20 copies)
LLFSFTEGERAMFRRVRITPSTLIAIVALVFAATGGAFAATDGSGPGVSHATASAAKSKPKAKAGPRGPAGPKGTTGATGPAGPAGPAGATGGAGPQGNPGATGETGKTGEPGKNGTNGTNGTSVTSAAYSGSECKEGGSEFTAGKTKAYACNGEKGVLHPKETLPPGATETGDWGLYFTASGPNEIQAEAISFPIPLKEAPEHNKTVSLAEKETAECPGGVTDPQAQPGYLCLFEGKTPLKKSGLNLGYVTDPATDSLGGAGTTGAVLFFFTQGLPPVNAGEEVSSEGVWAVTAK